MALALECRAGPESQAVLAGRICKAALMVPAIRMLRLLAGRAALAAVVEAAVAAADLRAASGLAVVAPAVAALVAQGALAVSAVAVAGFKDAAGAAGAA